MANFSLKAVGVIVFTFLVIICIMFVFPLNEPETKALPPYRRQDFKVGAKTGNSVTRVEQVKAKHCVTCATQSAYTNRDLDFCLSLAKSESEKNKVKENYKTFVENIPSFDDVEFAHQRFKKSLKVQRNNCIKTKFAVGDRLPRTTLASVPGSGNTWSRHLIELVTGYYTGSVYGGHRMLSEFPGEAVSYDSGKVIAIKTHHSYTEIKRYNYTRVILVIRDPVASIKSEYNRKTTHNKTLQVNDFNQKSWDYFVSHMDYKFLRYGDWISASRQNNLDLFLLFYNDLINDMGRALVKLAYFLGVDLSPRDLQCALNNQEGVFHRNKSDSPLDQASVKNTSTIDQGIVYLKEEIAKCLDGRACTASGCGFLFL